MGNVEYAAAFSELILPVIAAFGPDLIIFSCGFDAARGDLIGDCDLTPDMYHTMTKSILVTAGINVPLVVALEGGYNLDVNALCMEAVVLALLDQPFDEEGTTKEIPSSQSCGNRNEMLYCGRKVLSNLWDNEAVDKHKKGKAKHAAIKAINKSIRAIRRSPIWKGSVAKLKDIPDQRFNEESKRTTRSQARKLTMEKLGDTLKKIHL